MKKLSVVFVCLSALLLAGCATFKTGGVDEQSLSLELRAAQQREIAAEPVAVFRSVMSVLQDRGYLIISADRETGFITAKAPTQQIKDTNIFLTSREQQTLNITASIEPMRESTQVRFNMVNSVSNTYQSDTRTSTDEADHPITDPKVYTDLFDKIEEAVFLRTQ